jgi:pyrroline-5-carboxylate reductase
MKQKVGLIGFGNMGSAIYEKAKDAFDFRIYEKDISKTGPLPPSSVENDLHTLMAGLDACILAVKPQDLTALLQQLPAPGNATVISIAAGIPTALIERALPGAHVIRVMPNLPAKVGKGMSCIAKGKKAIQKDLTIAENIFKKVGQVMLIEEPLMNAATAVSGSGPGFFFEQVVGKSPDEATIYAKNDFKEQLLLAAHAVGFFGATALALASATTAGAVEMLRVTKLPPEQLRDQVTSKGGTTEAGLKVLRQTHSLTDAVKAAMERAAELAKA